MLVALPVLTGYVLKRMFDVPGWSGRPLTGPAGAFDWLDRTIGTRSRATVVPAPVSRYWFASEQYWRDFEWWNKSVVRDVQYPEAGRFEYTGIWFPKLYISFDPRTGVADRSPTPWAVQSLGETRFRLSGATGNDRNGVRLIHAGRRWRADWLTLGAYDDGWTMPGVATRVRVFARPGQRGPLIRYLTIHVAEPTGRPVTIASNLEAWDGDAPARHTVQVCVPARGFADVRLASHEAGPIPGDQRDAQNAQFGTRRGGVHIGDIALADETGGPCRPRR